MLYATLALLVSLALVAHVIPWTSILARGIGALVRVFGKVA